MDDRLDLGPEGLTDGVVRIRHLVEGDAQAYAAGMSDPAVAPFGRLPRGSYTTETVRDDIRTRIAHGLRDNQFALLTVADAVDDVFLGSILLSDLDWDAGTGEVQFWLTADARGQGLAADAVTMLCRWCFDELGLKTILARTAVADIPSHHVLTKAGFRRADGDGESLVRWYRTA